MKLIICLGNPGTQYEKTRHNAGFMFADKLADKLGASFLNEPKFKSHIAKTQYKSEAVWIVKPQTYMNLSGEALQALKSFYKIDINDLFIVFDDISLDTGRIRLRAKGSDGGHNGVKSIVKYAQTEKIPRIKIGIGPQPPFMKSEDYVLQKFTDDQFKLLEDALNKSVDALLFFCDNDIAKAQNKYNN